MNLQPVILCGGSGTRLWPLSREQYPKQLLALVGEQTMLQPASHRIDGSSAAAGRRISAPIVVSNEEYRFITAEQLRQTGVAPAALVLEPFGRGTAPALTLAALAALDTGVDSLLLMMPADHVISDVAAFRSAVVRGTAYAEAGKVVAFGVRPISAQTGYGYIRAASALADGGGGFGIAAFVEKPDATTAKKYVSEGYLWNSGNFLFRADVLLAELARLEPEMADTIDIAVKNAPNDLGFLRLDPAAFARAAQKSIDYAVMEKTKDAAVVPVEMGWTDAGSWSARGA